MKISEKILSILEMGRVRSEAVDKFEALRPRIVEHLWKLYAYHAYRSQDVNSWLVSLNKYLIELRRYNIQKGATKKINLDKSYFEDKLIKEDFESIEDLETLDQEYNLIGFPKVFVSDEDVTTLQKLANAYISHIFNKSPFRPNKNSLSSFKPSK